MHATDRSVIARACARVAKRLRTSIVATSRATLVVIIAASLARAQDSGPTLLILDGATGEPLAGADVVWCVEASRPQIAVQLGQVLDDWNAETREAPSWTKTDVSGRVTLPRERADLLRAFAFHAQLAGEVSFRGDTHDVVRVELRPTDDFLVRVVDSNGKPARDVSIRFRADGARGERFARARTTSSGIARFRGVDAWLRSADARFPVYVELEPILGLPAFESRRYALRARPATQPFELTLPPTVSLVVRLRDARGEARVGYGSIEGLIEGERVPDILDVDWRSAPLRAIVRDGEVRLPWLPPACWVQLRFTCAGLAAPIVTNAHLPSEAGRELVVDESPLARAWVGMRIIDHDGSVASLRKFDSDLERTLFGEPMLERRGAWSDMTTNAQGDIWLDAGVRSDLEDGIEDWLGLQFDGRERVVVRIPRAEEAGETRLEVVRLRVRPVFVAGRVFDPDGNPVRADGLWIERKSATGAWEPVGEETTLTDDGAFRVMRADRSGEFTLRALRRAAPAGVSERVHFVPGQSDVVVPLKPFAELSGTLKLPAGLRMDAFEIELEPEQARLDATGYRRAFETPLDALGAFHARGLMPGRCSVRVRAKSGELVWRSDAVVLAPGVTTLPAIDISELVQRVRVEVVDPAGQLVEAARVRVPADTWLVPPGAEVAPGVYELFVRRGGSDVSVASSRGLTASLTNVHADQRVVLKAGVDVRVRATGPEPLALGTFALALEFECVEPERGCEAARGMVFTVVFASAREVTAVAPAPGAYRATWIVRDAAARDGRMRVVSVKSLESFVVDREASELRIDIVVPRDALARAVPALVGHPETPGAVEAPRSR